MSETIADIVAYLRQEASDCPNIERAGIYDRYADRIEAAWKRQEQCYLDQIRDAVNMIGHERFVKEHPSAGDAAAMRDALEQIRDMIMGDSFDGRSPAYIVNICDAALSTPPRNCDVGTAEEQRERFMKFCAMQDCKVKCPMSKSKDMNECVLNWAQMPYENGGGK